MKWAYLARWRNVFGPHLSQTGQKITRMNVQQPSLISNHLATTVLKSVCRSCHGGCGVLLHVRDGVLVKVEGDRESPLNHGRLCPIGTVTTDLVYHKDRLKYPLRRKGKRQSGEWERIS